MAKTMKAPTKAPTKAAPREKEKKRSADPFAVHREKLLRKREDMLAMYRKDLRMGQETNDDPTEDIVDRANNSYSRELTFSLSDGERALLLQIEDSLSRLEAGTYGRCAHCGEAISSLRLEALPWARLCIDCQELLEKGMLSEP